MPITTIRQTVEGSIMLGDSQEDASFDISQSPAVMQTIARRALLSFPWLRDLQIVRAWAALRVMPPDGLSIYDQSERFPGAFTANCHSGVTLAGAHVNLFAPMVAAGALDTFGGEILCCGEAAGDRLRLGRGERREIDRELKAASRSRPPAGIQRIAADARRQRKRCAGLRGGAREGRKLGEGVRVSPVHVLDDHEKRLTAGGSVD